MTVAIIGLVVLFFSMIIFLVALATKAQEHPRPSRADFALECSRKEGYRIILNQSSVSVSCVDPEGRVVSRQ